MSPLRKFKHGLQQASNFFGFFVNLPLQLTRKIKLSIPLRHADPALFNEGNFI